MSTGDSEVFGRHAYSPDENPIERVWGGQKFIGNRQRPQFEDTRNAFEIFIRSSRDYHALQDDFAKRPPRHPRTCSWPWPPNTPDYSPD